jgi:hypothetical protein
VVLVISVAAVVVGPPTIVICSVVRITPVITIVATRVRTIVSRISVVAVPVRWVTESDSYRADSNRNPSVSLFHRYESQSDCYQWK